jgi:hypothetical protein
MTLGEVLDRTFQMYKANFWLFTGIVAIPYLIVVIFGTVYSTVITSAAPPPSPQDPAVVLRALGVLLLGISTLWFLNMLVFAAAQAATVIAVSDLYLGRPVSLRGSYAKIGKRFFPILLTMVLIYLMVGAGTLLFVIPGIVLACRTAVALPAATLEDVGAGGAISRSFQLTKGGAAQIFAVYVLFFFLMIVSSIIFHFPFYIVVGSPFKPHAMSFGMQVLQALATWVSGVIVAPLATIAFSLIYYNQRVRKEAFDLEQLMASLEPAETPPAPSVV